MRALVDPRELDLQTRGQLALYKQRLERADEQPGRLASIVSSALLSRQIEPSSSEAVGRVGALLLDPPRDGAPAAPRR